MKALRNLIALVIVLAVTGAGADEEVPSWVFISAPIFPQVCPDLTTCAGGLYAFQGPAFPATLEGEQQLVRDASLTFDELLTACAEFEPEITLQAPGAAALTQQQLATNFEKTARCSNAHYGVRPVWIPQLVDDVDICDLKMGPGWHLLHESELNALAEADRELLKGTLTTAAGADSWGNLYFSLMVYVRGDDGVLKLGTIEPGQSPRIWALPIPEAERKYAGYGVGHSDYTTAAVRCIRTAPAL